MKICQMMVAVTVLKMVLMTWTILVGMMKNGGMTIGTRMTGEIRVSSNHRTRNLPIVSNVTPQTSTPYDVSGLPHCSTLTEAELASMTDCDNSTIVEEVRLRDPLFERLFSQLWHDAQVNLNYSYSSKLHCTALKSRMC